jgi:hypothetical protein
VEDTGQGETIEVDVAQSNANTEVHGEIGDPVHVTVQVLDHVHHDLDQYVPRQFPHF